MSRRTETCPVCGKEVEVSFQTKTQDEIFRKQKKTGDWTCEGCAEKEV